MNRPLVIVTGLSGSGKSLAVRVFEDKGYYCVDNLPVTLIPVLAELFSRGGETLPPVALVIDIREREFLRDFPAVLQRVRGTQDVSVLFFEAENGVLARRFNETRRPHPMASGSGEDLLESIQREREALDHIRAVADVVIDTSAFTVHDLKAHLLDNFLAADPARTLLVLLVSFGYKYGVPEHLDLLFDVRFLTNPFFVETLKGRTGQDREVVDFLEGHEEYGGFLEKCEDLLRYLLPLYVREGKSYLRVGIGCTGGKHRSVAVAERIGRSLERQRIRLRIQHRDLDRE
jgi:UPF0042 nucleotide-binding protein